ncbi:MAG TPA: hypothetical protein VGC60_01110 [Pyrinomonadaceae bacterium]|jgi:hypothetical protein
MPKTKENEIGPFTVTAKFPKATLTIEAEESGGKFVFRKKIEGQCRMNETFDDCVVRLSQLFVTYGDLTF